MRVSGTSALLEKMGGDIRSAFFFTVRCYNAMLQCQLKLQFLILIVLLPPCYSLRELEPGLGISRLEAADFTNFLTTASLFTGFVRLTNPDKESPPPPPPPPPATAAPIEGSAEGVDAPAPPPPPPSPFACLSATMGWETFRMVHILWIGQLDVPAKSDAKDWELQASHVALLMT